jgi:hypothetical protein
LAAEAFVESMLASTLSATHLPGILSWCEPQEEIIALASRAANTIIIDWMDFII